MIKIYLQVKKYGKNTVFRLSHEENELSQLELVAHILNRQNVSHILKIDDSSIVCISRSGIYIIKILGYTGKVEGNVENLEFSLNDKGTCQINNFFLELKNLEEKLNLNYPIKRIIVKREICMLDVSYPKEYKVIGIHHFYFKFQKMNRKIIYTEEEVESIYEEIKKLSNNVKL